MTEKIFFKYLYVWPVPSLNAVKGGHSLDPQHRARNWKAENEKGLQYPIGFYTNSEATLIEEEAFARLATKGIYPVQNYKGIISGGSEFYEMKYKSDLEKVFLQVALPHFRKLIDNRTNLKTLLDDSEFEKIQKWLRFHLYT